MKNKNVVLLKTLLLSSGNSNILKYSTDERRRKRVRGDIAGPIVLYVFLLCFSTALAVGYGITGLTAAIPKTAVITIAALSFILTLLKTNGYLFNFKEYDMLMAMPIEVRDIAACKFAYMYIRSLPVMVLVSISNLAGYAIFVRPSFGTYIYWIILSLFIPLIPMVIASAIGAVFTRIGSGMRYKNLAQAVLIIAFVVIIVFGRFVLEAVLRKGEGEMMMQDVAGAMDSVGTYYPPAEWFSKAVVGARAVPAVVFLTVSVGLFLIFVSLVSISYRKINSALMSGSTHKEYRIELQKRRNVVGTIALKEFKRFTGSITYLTNIGLSVVFTMIIGIVALFVPADELIATVLQGAPITKEMLMPAIPMILYFFLGMVASTCCSPSLEGKNYWILKSMPVRAMDVYRGKIRFNMLLMTPPMIFATLTLGISAKASAVDILIYIVEGTALLLFSSCFGLVCGLKHMRTDWKNEIEVIKQGTAVMIYLFPNMLVTMGLIVGVVVLGMHISGTIVSLCLIAAALLLTALTVPAIKRSAAKGV